MSEPKEVEMECGTIVTIDPSADGVCHNCIRNVIDWVTETSSEMLGQDVPYVPAAMIRNATVDGRWVLTLQVLLPLTGTAGSPAQKLAKWLGHLEDI